MRLPACFLLLVLASTSLAQFKLAPAVAVEAEDFSIESGWKVVKNGDGNYMVDMIGFSHISGERLLSLDGTAKAGKASAQVQVPKTGKYRLWVRYEYPPFTDVRFRVVVEQGGKKVAEQVMGKKDSLRYAALSGRMEAKAQHDPSWGPEGIVEEVMTIADLKEGKASILLLGEEQPQIPGRAANRNVDLVYLTSDTEDAWLKHYARQTNLYPILDAFRDTRGPRWQVRFTNRGAKPGTYRIAHVYNRIPWGYGDPAVGKGVLPGATSEWIGLLGQDTAHFGTVVFTSSAGAFDVELRPAGGTTVAKKLSGAGSIRVYLPPYPGKGEQPTTPEEAIDRVLADLKTHKAPGKKPTQPLCYGGWTPLGQDNAYGRKYAELYAALGFRSLHPANSGPFQVKNLEAAGVPASKSWMVMGYRNPPTKANIDKARARLEREKLTDKLRFFDYGDEIGFSEWLGMMVAEEIARDKKLTAKDVIARHWLQWLKANRPKQQLKDYWLDEWGPFNPAGFRPDSSANAAKKNPRLYVDSILFYEDAAIRFAADGAKAVRAALGDDVLCGANYSCHPFYYPHSTMYIKWFRGGAADMGRHSEYFWQVAQLGPMVNGYVAEHFRCGMRDNPRAVLRQYTMPHAPGNTDANFLRTAFSHLAHGATMLDFFGIGMNETFTENHIDHRAVSRYRALRDVTHCVGFVEDLLPQAKAVSSDVALLVSESTERWDYANIAEDRAGHALFGPKFRQTRLHYHLERLGIWKALTFLGHSPDLVTEEDVINGKLTGKKLLVLVGDHWPREMVPAIEKWVRAGGHVLATAGSGQKDAFGAPMKEWYELAGLKSVKTEQRDTFLRPRQELAFLKPLGTVAHGSAEMPVLATRERFETTSESSVMARFVGDKAPACVRRPLGKGWITYVAAHPGLAFLWSAMQPPKVPDRGLNTHSMPAKWDLTKVSLLSNALTESKARPQIVADAGAALDARLLEAAGGYVLPIASYEGNVGKKVRLSIHGTKPIKRVVSAYHGELPHTQRDGGAIEVTLPTLGYGDILRLEKK